MNRKRSYNTAFRDMVSYGAGIAAGAAGPDIASGVRRIYRHVSKRYRRTISRQNNSYNSGYTIHNRKAVNTKRRRRYRTRNMRIRRAVVRKRQLSGIAGKLLEKVYKRYVNMNEIEVERGRVCLPNCQLFGVGSFTYLPLQLIELNNVDHNAANICRQLYYVSADDTGITNDPQYYFSSAVLAKQDADGESGKASNSYSFGSYLDSCVSTNGAPNQMRWYHKKTTVDLLMYGQTDQDTLFRIDIVKFDPSIVEWIDTAIEANTDVNNGTSTRSGEWKQLWHSLIMPYVQNPLAKRPRPSKLMKILKTYKFKIPEQSKDFDRVQSVKTRITVPFNRIVDRYWRRKMQDDAYTANVNPESESNMNKDDFNNFDFAQYGNGRVRPKDRVYMMIRATNNDNRTGSEVGIIDVDKGADPTYDINLVSSFVKN